MPWRPPARRSTTASSSSGLNGLRMYASAPTSSARSRVPEPEPVSMTTGIPAVRGSAFSRAQSTSPSMPGMPTSRTIASGGALGGRGPGDGGVGRLLDLDVDGLEGRANEGPEPWIVVD